MEFFRRFFENVFREGSTPMGSSSFGRLSSDELEKHLDVDHYGDFLLTEAVRPSYDLQVVPREGYRHDAYQDDDTRTSVPVVMAAVSRTKLFDVFMDLLDPLGMEVDVVLETSHDSDRRGHVDLYREHIDLPVLKSILYEFEDLLMNDGCTGIAVLNPGIPLEVQFDEHKLLIAYGDELASFEDVFREHRVARRNDMKFITEAEHVHSSNERYVDQFNELKYRLGIDSVCAVT